MSFVVHVLIVLCLVKCGVVKCFPQGATVEACESLLPRHFGTYPQGLEHSPFTFMASADRYHYKTSGIKVQLYGPRFKGFLIAALDPDTHERIGDWIVAKGTQSLPCSAITHTDPFPKMKVILLWTPPKYHLSGRVIFVATVLSSFNTYFTGLVAKIPAQQQYAGD